MGGSISRDYVTKNKYLKECLRKFDPNEIEVLHKIFKELSSRSLSSGIDKETFLQYFNLPGLWGEQLFRKFDINSSGAVELDEFLIGIAVSCRGTRSEKIFVLFKLFDLNNDNLIHKFELLAMLSNFPKLTKYIYTSIDNSESLFNTRNRNEKIVDRNFRHNNYMFNQLHMLYQMDRSLISDDTTKYNIPRRTSSQESLDSRQSSHTADSIKILKSKECSETHSTDKFSRSMSDFSHYSKPMSAFLSKYFDASLENSGKPSRRLSVKKLMNRTKSMFATTDLPDTPLKMNKYLVNFYSESSNSSYTNEDFDTFPVPDSSPDSWSDIDIPDINKLAGDDPALAVINSIIQEHEESEVNKKSDFALEMLVDQILEECEFNETGSMCYDMFKAWVEKNDSILTMFSECLHEEVWGLKGHAFHNMDSPNFGFMETKYNFSFKPSDCPDGSLEKQDSKTTYDIDDITVRAIYHIFLVKGKHPFAFTMENNLNAVLSEELLEMMKTIDIEKYKAIMTDGQTPASNAPDYPNNTDKFVYEIFSCPSCKTPFLMCPVCYKKHNALTLCIETNNIYIKCTECCSSNDNEMGVFKSCWICCWSFNEIFKSITLSKHKSNDQASPSYSEKTPTKEGYVNRQMNGVNGEIQSMSSLRSLGSNKSINFNVTTKSGWMYKIGKTLHQWKSRYYVLVGNILYYYKDEESVRPKGCIFLEGCYLDTLRKRQIGNKHGFSICHKGNKFSKRDFYVESMQELLDWTELLTHAMKQQIPSSMYDICEQLGQGKFSIVYRAIYKPTGEEFAVKIIDKTKITHQERELLRCEISILKLLKHNHVIYLKEIIDMKDSLYIIMELVRGGELYDLIHTEHRLSEAHTHRIISQLLHTVAYLHRCGIIHRDLKPENLLLTDRSESGSIKLTDFGLSTLCGPNDILMQPCGTLAYVAPEVLTMQGYNQKSDVWSIGVIMYLLIRGRLPFAIKKSQSIHIWDHYKVGFEGSVWRSISSSAKDLIRKLLEIDPAKRITVFEALDHIWVKNFVAVNNDSPTIITLKDSCESEDFYQSIRNTTDTTFVLPYSESCDRNLNTLHCVKYMAGPAGFDKDSESSESSKKVMSKVLNLPPVQE